MLLLQLKEPSHICAHELNEAYAKLATQYNEFIGALSEALTPVEGDLDQQLAELSKRFEAAKRGLSIVSKKSYTLPDKQKHLSAILTNMNKIRGMLAQVTKQVAANIQQEVPAPGSFDPNRTQMFDPHNMPLNPPLSGMRQHQTSRIGEADEFAAPTNETFPKDGKGPYKHGDIVWYSDPHSKKKYQVRVLQSHSKHSVVANGPKFSALNTDLSLD